MFGGKPFIKAWDIPQNTVIHGIFKNFPQGEDVPEFSKDGKVATKYRKYEVKLKRELAYGGDKEKPEDLCSIGDVVDIQLPYLAMGYAWSRSSIQKPDLIKQSKDVELGILKKDKKLYHFVLIDGNEIRQQQLQSITEPPPIIQPQ